MNCTTRLVLRCLKTQVTFDILLDFSFQFALDILIVKQEGELGNLSELSHLGLKGLFHTLLQIVYFFLICEMQFQTVYLIMLNLK